MDKDKLLALILPGLQGSVSISLNDQQIGVLIKGFLGNKTSYINSVKSKNGFLELSLQLPVIGEKSVNMEIDSIDVNSSKLLVSLKLLNVARLLVKGLAAISGRYGVESELKGENLVLDLTEKWKDTVSKLPEEAKAKLNFIKIGTAFTSNKAEVIVQVA